MELVQIIWIVLIVLFIVVEMLTSTLVSVWFFLGALVAFLVSLFAPGALVIQFAVFLAVSIVALLALRPFARRFMRGRHTPTNADANVGKTAQVVAEVQPDRFGRVKLEGLEWTAKADVVLPVGSWCRVEGIEGVKLLVSPLDAPLGKEESTSENKEG